MKLTDCPGCLKPYRDGYCSPCCKRLFGGRKISPILPFTRPDFNRVKNSRTSRISISGVQIKHSLRMRGSVLELADEGGEYILKPIPNETFQDVTELPGNEHVTMQSAGRIFGMDVAANAMVFFGDGEPAYLTKRFDRNREGGKFQQEDFAQLSGRSEESHGGGYKYDGSYEEVADLLKEHVGPYAIEVEKLFQQVVFNYLVLNGDAHLKNFSVFRDPAQGIYRLTPAYDLVNTRLHLPDEAGDLALDLLKDGVQTASFNANAFYARDDFLEFGKRIGMKPKRISAFMDRFTSGFDGLKTLIGRSFLKDGTKARYLELVMDRIGRLNYSYSAPKRKK